MANKALIGVLLALAMTGCGSQSPSGDVANTVAATDAAVASSADFDPCSVLTPAEVAAITTDQVIRAERQDDTCVYHSKPDDGVQLTIHPTGGSKQMTVVHNANKLLGGMAGNVAGRSPAGADAAAAIRPGDAPAPAIGDEAVWEANATLAVRKGDVFVEASPPIMHDPDSHPGYPLVAAGEKRTIATRLVETALAKLTH